MSYSEEMLKLPSEVKDKKFLRMPDTDKVIDSDDEWRNCGKWILLNVTRDISWIDEAWKNLQILVEKGILLMLKASTSAMQNEPGVVMCFTRPGEDEVKQTAKEIRRVVQYEGCMYYKINQMTECGIDHRYRHKRIASYMYTVGKLFYRRRNEEDWSLVSDYSSESQHTNSILSGMSFRDYTDINLDQLPSRSGRLVLEMVNNNGIDKYCSKMIMYMTCNLEHSENNLSEADRLWILGKQFLNEKVISNITYELTSGKGNIKLFFPKELDDGSLVDICRQIHYKAQVFHFIRITIGDKTLRYSPEGELHVTKPSNIIWSE